MANTIDFNVNTNAVTVLNQTATAADNTAQGFSSAKAELRALNQQLLQMDSSSEEFKKASARAAELKDNISDLSAEISANAGNAFEGLSNNVSLFGSRLMDLDLKGAGQALTGVGNAVSRIDFKTLKDEVAGLAKGFGDLAFSVVANPYLLLGAAVAALGYTFRKELLSPITDIIAANDKLRSSIQFTSEEIAAAAGDEVKQIAKLEELKIVLNSTTTSVKNRKEAIKELKKINPEYFKDLDDEKIKYTDLNTQIDSYIKGLIAQSLAKAASSRIEQESAKYLDDEIKRKQDLETVTAKLAIAQAELADKSKAVEESGRNIFGGKSYGAGFERAKVTAAATGYSIQQLELEIKALNEAEFASKAAYEQRVADLVNFKKTQEAIAAGFGVTPPTPPKKNPVEVKREELGEVYDMEVSWNLKLVDEEKIKQDKLTELAMQGHKTRLIFTEEYKNAVIAADKQLYEARFALANASIDLLGTLFAKNKKAADVAFVLQKALAIGQVVVDTQREIAGYYANPTWKLSPDGGIALATAASTAAKLRAATSIATIAGTTIGKFMGGGSANVGGSISSTSAGGGTAAPSPANFAFVGNQPNQQQPPLQAYVVGTQVSSNLEAQQLIQNQSRLGG
jgi:hypothetical protein